MATTSMLKSKGLFTFSNYLSSVPEGSLFVAENVNIDRDGVIEPRRGIKVLGQIPDTAKQLIPYKNKILAHYGNAIAYSDENDPATFTVFKGKSDFNPAAVNIANDTITINSHGLVNQDAVIFSTTGTLPSPLVSGTTYYVRDAAQNTFKLSTAPIGAAIDITTQGTGTHTVNYDYVFNAVDANLRIKYIELNSNLYITTDTGIKKIYGLSPYYATSAGGFKALDVSLSLDLSTATGFFENGKEVAYRVTWGIKDINGNFIEGSPSYRSVIQNLTGIERNIIISFPVPTGITTDYFYRIYRTASGNLGGSGDEMRLVYEAAYVSGNSVTVVDEQPEGLRDTGTPLYTNEFSGEGILQANAAPPVAKDVAIYKNTAFYANTRTPHRLDLTLLGQDGLIKLEVVSAVGSNPITITTSSNHNLTTNDKIVLVGAGVADGTYTATVTGPTTFTIPSLVAASGTDVMSVFTSSIVVTKDSSVNTYYFVGRPEVTQVTYQTKAATPDGSYFLINSADDKIKYFLYFDKTGTTPAPTGLDTVGRVAVRADISDVLVVTDADVAEVVRTALEATGDFVVSDYTTIAPFFHTISTMDSGFAGSISYPSGIAGLVSPFAAPGDISVPQQGFGEDTTKNYVKLSSVLSPAQRIENTAKSLCFVINNNSNDVIFAYYTPDSNELPGSMFFEAKVTDTSTYTITSNNSSTGAMFNPAITSGQSSTNEVYSNRLYFSKAQQPEAVPLTNSIDIGPRDKAILRIIGLRDSLFILKEEGVYRLTGENFTNFSVALFDNSININAPDSACVLNNQIYCLTTQGIATISETGVGIISRPIENIFTRITSPGYDNYSTASFGVGYEADRAYLLFTIDSEADTVATACYRYNTFTQSWTTWKKEATCGVVEPGQNKLYLGASDIPAVEIERKAFTSRDYADREYIRNLAFYGDEIFLDNTSNVEIGDMLTQTQYLTHYQYNRLVKKAKQDSLLQMDANFAEITNLGADLQQAMIDLAAQLNSKDTSLITTSFNTATDVNIGTDTITITAHGLLDNDVIQFTGTTLPAPLVAGANYVVVNATTNTFKVSTQLNGSAIDITSTGSGIVTVDEVYYSTGSNNFATLQEEFNYNVNKLNASSGVYFSNYQTSSGSKQIDLLITSVTRQGNKVEVADRPMFFLGPMTHYKSIKSSIVWAPMSFNEPSISKHIREGVFIIETPTLKAVTVGFATDLSGNFEDIEFNLNGEGGFGDSDMGNVVWGGQGISWPLRTLVPRQKQRCRYIRARFKHSSAMYKFSILGIAYTYEPVSERSYR